MIEKTLKRSFFSRIHRYWTFEIQRNKSEWCKTFLRSIFPFTGVGIAIVKDGKVYTRGFGLADIEGRRNFDADTIACGGSTGKFFTATLLAILMTEHNRRGKKWVMLMIKDTRVQGTYNGKGELDIWFFEQIVGKQRRLVEKYWCLVMQTSFPRKDCEGQSCTSNP